ncbi:TonB-dependent receptor plug domain-containing protein [Pelagicoccus mobilis]|uniref:TonB-dependent receptor plug domain-containing protein n=1 Tax=Pelagicoccus mobilis TaxID=415221 RepID=A0A934VRU2_9BACT|nr:TonB-dependent receptor plug domain-containing protein [Pelagicoccus mobilis]MBK1878315.1 TonB-dependent receptor plug domain-containing protein [Pelagicoccus mobilis]
MNKSIKLNNRYAWPRSASGAIALGAALLVAPLGIAQNDDEEDVYELSPFTIEGEANSGYRATSTLAGSRIRTDLKDVGSSISVVTEEFLRDTSATDNESLLIYTGGTEVAGTGGNFAGGGDFGRVDTDSQRLRPNAATRVRGLAAADNTRDFFKTDIPWDSYNVDRIDLQRGPNSILFGLGSPAGVINATTNTAYFEDGGDFEARYGSYGSWRASLDYNKVLIEDELAVRVSLLNDEQDFMQDGAFEDDQRIYVAMKWEPKALSSDSASTSIRVNYENGEIDANRPRVIPPIDRITQWFRPVTDTAATGMGKATYTVGGVNAIENGFGSGSYDPWINAAVGRIFDGPTAVYESTNQSSQDYYFLAGGGQQTGVFRGIGAFDSFSKKVAIGSDNIRGLPGSSITAWKPTTISDPTIFDFYDKLIDGPNKSEWQEWDSYNITFSRSMMDNKLGIELVYDAQDYVDGQTNLLDNWGQSLSIDMMATIPNGTAEGMPNPNLGRPYVGGDAQNNQINYRDRENFRFTGFYEVDFNDNLNEELASIFGKHRFTGVYGKSTFDQRSASWMRATSSSFNTGNSITQASRYIANLVYLGPSLLSSSSASGANLDRIHSELIPTDGSFQANAGTVSNTVWSEAAGDISNLYRRANLASNEIDSKAFVWQGFMFDGNVVPVFGYRDDTDNAANAGNVPGHPDGIAGAVDPFGSSWMVPGSTADVDIPNNKTYVSASGISKTFSMVVHTPQEWRDQMNGWGVSLTYSDSENFRPDASRRDLVGSPISPSRGETTEYGIVISGLNDRFSFRANYYETEVTNDTLSASSISNSYMIGAGEGWGMLFAKMAEGGKDDFWRNYALEDPEAGFDADTNPYINPEVEVLRYQPAFTEGMSAAERSAEVARTLAIEQGVVAAFNDPSNYPSQQFRDFWGQNWDAITPDAGWGAGGAAWNGEPSAFAITGDTASEGWEYELFYQPTDNWNIALNATKTSATRSNLARTYSEWVESRWDVINNTAYGDARLWGPGFGGETVRSKYGSEFYSSYQLFKQLEGSDVAELRPWRLNVVTNYNFSDGMLAGASVGGAFRWQDEVVTGYPVIILDDAGTPLDRTDDVAQFDVDNPFTGGSESNIDLWAAYETSLSDNIDWRIQLNIRNAFEDESLIPVTVQPDGSPATSRISEGMTWTLTNTFKF